jgi:L-lactate dehydrogenase complex protein LldG
MYNSKEIILQNIKNALNAKPDDEFNLYDGFNNEDYITGDYNNDLVDEFSEKLRALSGSVEIINNTKHLNKAVTAIFDKTDSKSFTGWDTEELAGLYKTLQQKGFKYTKSTRNDLQAKCDIGITLADYAISESGTIVLYNNKIQNRNCSLIVPIHIAILQKEKIVKSIFDIISTISKDYSSLDSINELSNCITLITGPSRTADIELILTLGVHGPKELYVLVV